MYENKVRFPVIWNDIDALTEEEELALRALGQNIPENLVKGSAIIDLGSIESWHTSKSGTKVNLKSGDFFDVDIDEAAFSMLYTEFTSTVIKDVQYTRVREGDYPDDERDRNFDNEDNYGDDYGDD